MHVLDLGTAAASSGLLGAGFQDFITEQKETRAAHGGHSTEEWEEGDDIELLDKLSEIGGFTYTIVNLGRATYISQSLDYRLPAGDGRSLTTVAGTNMYDGTAFDLPMPFSKKGCK